LEDAVDVDHKATDIHVNVNFKVLEEIKMADVLVTFKVMPEAADVDMDKLVDAIKDLEGVKINDIRKNPIAFGLVALEPSFIIEDKEGATKALEEKLGSIKGIGEVEVSEVTLV